VEHAALIDILAGKGTLLSNLCLLN